MPAVDRLRVAGLPVGAVPAPAWAGPSNRLNDPSPIIFTTAARSGDRIAIAAYLGSGDALDRAILEFSKAYAEQNERDYQALVEAVKSGRVTAETGV